MYSHGAGVRPITPAVSVIFWTAATLGQVFFISLWKSNSQGEIAARNNTDSKVARCYW